jgi:hypothetical protein
LPIAANKRKTQKVILVLVQKLKEVGFGIMMNILMIDVYRMTMFFQNRHKAGYAYGEFTDIGFIVINNKQNFHNRHRFL